MSLRRHVATGTLLAMLGVLSGGASASDEPTLRDPFLPVGYMPAPVSAPQSMEAVPVAESVAPVGVTDWIGARGAVRVSGVSQLGGGPPQAIINGQWISLGERFVVTYQDLKYEFVVSAISADGVRVAQGRVLSVAPSQHRPDSRVESQE